MHSQINSRFEVSPGKYKLTSMTYGFYYTKPKYIENQHKVQNKFLYLCLLSLSLLFDEFPGKENKFWWDQQESVTLILREHLDGINRFCCILRVMRVWQGNYLMTVRVPEDRSRNYIRSCHKNESRKWRKSKTKWAVAGGVCSWGESNSFMENIAG